MSLVETFAFAIIVLAGAYLVVLGAASLFASARASRFLLGFASSQRVHLAEMFLRLLVGGALVLFAPRMPLSPAFGIFGWVLIATTTCLLLIPWEWHHRFAQRAVPLFTRRISVLGVVSLAIGGFILWAASRGAA